MIHSLTQMEAEIEMAVGNLALVLIAMSSGIPLFLAFLCLWMDSGWKTAKGFLAVGTALALGVPFGVPNCVGGQ